MTWLIRHDLHEDFTESYDLEHLYLRLVAQLPLATGSHAHHSAARPSLIATPAVEQSRHYLSLLENDFPALP
jgi:hypothetical protein